MNLPNICQKTMENRVQYLSLIGYMGRIDGQLDAEEIALLEKMVKRLEVSTEYHEKVFSQQSYSEEQIEAVFKELKQNDLQYSFFLDLITMAIADGIILEPERMMLAQIAGLIGLPHEEFHNLINFIQATSSLDEHNHNDPMYQYVIDMFFQWARQKNVTLFKQTFFAINENVDAALKKNL